MSACESKLVSRISRDIVLIYSFDISNYSYEYIN